MMRVLCASAGFAVLGVMAVVPAIAQSGSAATGIVGDATRTSRVFALIRAEAVQKDLVLTEDQKLKLAPLFEQYDMSLVDLSRRPIPEPGNRPGREEQSREFAERQRKKDELVEKTKPGIVAVLTAEQTGRLNQIFLQSEGGNALHESDVRAKLALTSEQQKRLLDISKAFGMNAVGSLRESRKGGSNSMILLERFVNERDMEMLSVLTPKQIEQLQSMRGKEFDVKLIDPNLSPLTLPPRH